MFFLLGQGISDAIEAKLASAHLNGALVSAYVQEVGGVEIYQKNAAIRVMPASNQKILSVSYALARLGPDFRARTRFWREMGRVVIDAPGNPMMTYEQMKAARAKVGKSAVVNVRQAYRVGVPGGWELDDLPNRYAAPVTALTLDQSSFELWGENGRVFFLPEAFGATARKYGGAASRVEYDPFTRVAKVYGPIPKSRTRLDTLALHNPDHLIGQFFGGSMSSSDSIPSRAPDYEAVAPPLKEVATTCLVKSDNNIAENLMLMAAASEGPLSNKPYEVATARMKKFLTEEVGCAPEDLRPQDGSGMSRHNFVTTRALARISAWATQKWGALWTDALAAPGKGTLAGRLEGSGFRGKTGTLDSACALTGTVKTPDGRTLVISLVFNHYTATSAQVRGVQDEIVRILEQSTIGTIFEGVADCEVALPVSSFGVVYGNWFDRSDHDRGPTRPREDRRAQSHHARPYRAQRMAIRPR